MRNIKGQLIRNHRKKGADHIKVFVACEESQAVCNAFRRRGHEAYSCDLQEPSGGHPEWHIKGDCSQYINGDCVFTTMDGIEHELVGPWDLLLGFPPCTYLTKTGATSMRVKGQLNKERFALAMEAKAFFLSLLNAKCIHIAIENPVPLKMVGLPARTQIIQPYEYGHPYSKMTCLWLKNLPLLKPTNIITEGIKPYVDGGHKDVDGKYGPFKSSKIRSKTFEGIAEAMADQWGDLSKS